MVTFILCNFYATLIPCTTLNCTLHYSNYDRSMFKAGQGEWPPLSCHRWYVANFELEFPSWEVVRVDWLVILVSYQHIPVLQMFRLGY